jgi:glycosyltransferase involved in cell wall biosynthesis
MARILFVHTYLTSFTKIDLEILRGSHEVRELHFNRRPGHLLQSMMRSASGAVWADIVVSWFGTFHALVAFAVARLLGRKCLVIASGYDLAAVPEIDYGNMRPGVRRLVGRAVLGMAHQVLAVSRFAAKEARENARVPAEKLRVIRHGLVDPTHGKGVNDFEKRGARVLSVGEVNQSNLTRKGLTTFVRAAHKLPNTQFELVGLWANDGAIEFLRSIAPANIEFAGRTSDADLMARMRTAKVYVQVSGHEAFGVALAEAMLHGCVPVVTDRGALPEVVGDAGKYVPYGDAEATAAAVREALRSDQSHGLRARQRILDQFPLALRSRELLSAVEDALAGSAVRSSATKHQSK